MALKKYNNLLTSGRWSNKDPKYLSILGVAQNLVDGSNKSSDKSNTSKTESTKGEIAYIRDPPPWIMEELKVGVGSKTKYGK